MIPRKCEFVQLMTGIVIELIFYINSANSADLSEMLGDLALEALQPTAGSKHSRWMSSGRYQGDIVLDGASSDPVSQLYSSAVSDTQLLWNQAIVPYTLSYDYRSWERQIIRDSLDRYENSSCIRFISRTTEHDYLHFVKGYGCYSQVGRSGGRQELSLGRGCLYHEIIVHEVLHALGFWHEHSRSDRDQHINIRWNNIMPGMQNQFDVVKTRYENTLNEPYDYRSVMHYDSKAFSYNGEHTMETSDPVFTSVIGTSLDLSELDLKKLNKLYNCPGYRGTTQSPTTTTDRAVIQRKHECRDEFYDCPLFRLYCDKTTFLKVMQDYCRHTCGRC